PDSTPAWLFRRAEKAEIAARIRGQDGHGHTIRLASIYVLGHRYGLSTWPRDAMEAPLAAQSPLSGLPTIYEHPRFHRAPSNVRHAQQAKNAARIG
ncbi:unnamed protein product, partial [Rhizoctonia solani]